MRIRGLIFLLFAYEIISIKENWKHSPPFLQQTEPYCLPPPKEIKAKIIILKTKQLFSRDGWALGKRTFVHRWILLGKTHLSPSAAGHWAVELIDTTQHNGITLLWALVLLRSAVSPI